MLIRQMPSENKPREKALLKGIKYLSDAELLAVIIQTGAKGIDAISLAKRTIEDSEGLYNLSKAVFTDIKERGLGEAKKLKIMAAFELGRRAEESYFRQHKVINCIQAARFGKSIAYDLKEKAILICLDKNLHLIKAENITSLSETKVEFSAKDLLRRAVNFSAEFVYLIHNHPSGFTEPSEEDILVTHSLINLFSSIGITLLDHIVVSKDKFYSIGEKKEYFYC